MRIKSLVAFAILACASTALAQTPSPDQMNAFKSLPKDQQDDLVQGVLGTSDGTGTKTDKKLSMPDTVRPSSDQTNENLGQSGLLRREKTSDGRRLRLPNEDPELRADDTVLIDLIPTYESSAERDRERDSEKDREKENAASNPAGLTNPTETIKKNRETNEKRRQADEKEKTDEEKKKLDDFRKRILKSNPYQLNRFGVLELPGLPAIPLAGLTAGEATKRLSADPELHDFTVKLSLLRLQTFGQEALKPFGYDLFEGIPSTFAPVSDIQVPIDYVVGPGDTFKVQLYGGDTASYVLTVGRDGRVNFPKLGPLDVSGMSFTAARTMIEQRVAGQLIGTRVSITMGDLRSIRVFVLGEAQKPGSYTVSGLSTMTNALFVSGGVKKIGSLRSIELKRNGRLVTVLDLYDLLLHGDTSGDRQLMPGDVIFIPPIGETVSVDGAVRRPAIYELKSEKTAGKAIELAGGLLPDADEHLVQLERILPSQSRETRSFNLDSNIGRSVELANGDKIRVPAIRPTLENSVELSGYVFRPGFFEYHPGMRLSEVVGSFDELRPNADPHYIMIRREVPPEERIEVISADLERALHSKGTAADPQLRPRDKIFVFDLSASRDRIVLPIVSSIELFASPEHPAQVVNIDGKVNAPGRYPLEPTMKVSDLIRAGGSLEDGAFGGEAELTRYQVVDGNARQSELIKIDLAAIRRGDAGADLPLKPYDVLVIKPTPLWEEPGSIVLAGQVRFPGKYPIHQGETLRSALQRAGGFTDIAFPEGAVFIRLELKKREKEQLELLTNRFQSDLSALSLQALATSAATTNSSAGGGGATQGIVVGQELLEQMRNTKPVGRLVIDVDESLKGPPGGHGDVLLRDGDMLAIPRKTQEITIMGEVQSPSSHIYDTGLTRDDYIAKSGGITQKADRKRIYVVRANGNVVSGGRKGWFRRSQSIEMRPGDTIVVPIDAERVRALPLWTAVTTIIYNIAIAVLALRTI